MVPSIEEVTAQATFMTTYRRLWRGNYRAECLSTGHGVEHCKLRLRLLTCSATENCMLIVTASILILSTLGMVGTAGAGITRARRMTTISQT